ncbi:MAG TPA: hypothetical protein PK087_03010 [Bacilli bacterium]|nr:MAG: hypothetical protein BWY97_00977 [Tenericutes bacterium ADurb.BinA124]HOH18276.1 hypothetical protein [Bacilli bacterium]HPX84761.1 hypothetical protein [Bacilli bacterium]HQC74781.1 hypothetical protein [Bacilli bacterium]
MSEITPMIFETLLKALALTLVCELVVLMLFRCFKQLYLVAILINIFTNIGMNLLILWVNPIHYHVFVIFMEIIVILIEFLIYYLFIKKGKQALLISLAANFTSYLVGLALMGLIY